MSVEVGERRIGKESLKKPEPEYRIFEGVQIQWGKGEWRFNHPELGLITKPTFSILNPDHWEEIAKLLKQGKTAAGMMMGNYGVYKRLERRETESADALFDDVKKRPRQQNFVALVHPEDIKRFVDFDRLQEPYRTQLRHRKGLDFYAGPQHVILPVRKNKVHPALVNGKDQTIACFWVKDHYGFEGMARQTKKGIFNNGLLGGGSLNIHGQEPFYNKDSLYRAMAGQKEWLEEIDFIIFDDIAEAGGIERSHTMVRYPDRSGENPTIIRLGSMSAERIRAVTGHNIVLDNGIKFASSKTSYCTANNAMVEARVIEVLQRTRRFNSFLRGFPATNS